MSSDNLPNKRSSSTEIENFLSTTKQLTPRRSSATGTNGRLIFALDATASRQPSWDRACQIQGQMFVAAEALGGLQLQLCYYRGFHEFHHSTWLGSSRSLLEVMRSVQCVGGYTQLERILNHCLSEHRQAALQAVIIIADAVEEKVDTLCAKAGQLGLLGVPLFMFQEGYDPLVKQCFQQMAHLSKGAYASFDEHSANELAELLAAVATFASGGFDALQRLQSGAARQLLQQLKP
jgi:hypothetical protein